MQQATQLMNLSAMFKEYYEQHNDKEMAKLSIAETVQKYGAEAVDKAFYKLAFYFLKYQMFILLLIQ